MSDSAVPRTIALLAPLSMEFSRPEYWSGYSFPSPADLPKPGIELGSPALQVDSLPTELWGKPKEAEWFGRHADDIRASLVVQAVKNLPAIQETWVWSLGQADPFEKGMATLSSILAWRIPWTEEPGEQLQFMGSQRGRHDWVTNTYLLKPKFSLLSNPV